MPALVESVVNTTPAVKPDSAHIEERPLFTVDDLIRSRAQSSNIPILAYPSSADALTEYTHYTAAQLSEFADEAARKYISNGITAAAPLDSATPSVVALLAPSDIDYIVSVFALVRLGYAVLLLSNRLSVYAIDSLLAATSCKIVIHAHHFSDVVAKSTAPASLPLLTRSQYVSRTGEPSKWPLRSAADLEKTVFIIHSSGSTGVPKPIFQSNKAALSNYASSFEMKAFITLPLYHNHGISSFFRAVYANKEIYFFNANLPLTSHNLTAVMEAVQPEIFYGVPYALKLLGETERGIACLRDCKLVLFGGSSCPDDLGDRLVDNGVNLVGHYGSTETGQLMTSFRPNGDKAWNYLRVNDAVKPYLLMDETSPGSNIYECVNLDGWKSKVVSNSDNPPNSFRTKDLFSPHPTIPNAWKYLGRIDDRVTLMNGEKVLPIPIEHRIREDPNVHECIVVGVGKSAPGLVLIPSMSAANLSPEEVIDAVWPAIADANSRAEGFSQIVRDLVMVFPADIDYPRTDKGTVIRAAFYSKFSHEIDALFQKFEGGDEEGDLVLQLDELENYLFDLFVNKLDVKLDNATSDFYAFGVDSLQAIRVWSMLKRTLDLGGNGASLSQNVVFEQPNCKALAAHLHSLRTGEDVQQDDDIEIMHELYARYSFFKPHVAGSITPKGETLIITGTTGSLGAHILAQSLPLAHVTKIYCLVRASNPEEAYARVLESLSSRMLEFDSSLLSKICALPGDFSLPTLGLPDSVIDELMNTLTTVIHSAWAVNFNIGVRSFEKFHINGAHNIIQLCLNVRTVLPAKFFFCSSISTAAGTPLPAVIREAPIDKFENAQNMGYARSKLVTEHIVQTAAETCGIHARVLRIGQIVGDSKNGVWNDSEAIPLMLRSALTLKALPALDETPSWLPVDTVASAALQLSGVVGQIPNDTSKTVYHITNPHVFRWTEDLLPALKAAGLDFRVVKQREWVKLLREGDQDPIRNPTVKLVNFFQEKYDNDRPGRRGLVFETQTTEANSPAMKASSDPVSAGLISKFVDRWLEKWV
ncbi:hypothetical protein V1512DRAFT_48948 [Lipomyces arxii]|uniref:uncharacterized protein n=1 Tax=Lipomyces arxii TaxID=56418 RepID=UPI0034CDBCCF